MVLAPTIQAITSVLLGDRKPGYYRHLPGIIQSLYKERRHSQGKEVLQSGLQNGLVPRLSQTAMQELQYVEGVLAETELSEEPDQRSSPFSKNASGLDSGAIYQLLKATGQPSDERATIVWRNAASPRIQMFMWLLLQGRIQCQTVLHRKHVLPDAVCEICNDDDESPEHIFSGCSIGRQFWGKLGLTSMVGTDVGNIHRTMLPRGFPKDEFAAFIALSCWQLWKTRNVAVFRDDRHNVAKCLQPAKLRQSNGASDFQGERGTLLINGVRFLIPQDKDE